MLVGLKTRFEPFVVNGSKRHTIRAERRDGRVPKIGELLHIYVNARQKNMRLVGRWPCTKVEPIKISILRRTPISLDACVAIDGVALEPGLTAGWLRRERNE